MTSSDIVERLRDGVNHDGRLDTLHAKAVEAIQELRRNRNWWQHQAQAFSEHADNLRIMMLEGPKPTLTDAERAALAAVLKHYEDVYDEHGASVEDDASLATLRGLLERMK